MGRPKPGHRRRYIAKAPEGLREPSLDLLLADLALIEAAGLRAAVELRGFACGDLADELCEVIERAYTVHSVAVLRLRKPVPIGGEPRA